MKTGGKGVSRRERLELTAAGLLPAALALVGPLAETAGRLCWLAPLAALPAGLWLCLCWERLGERDLGRGLEEAFGRRPGRVLALGYLLWSLLLLAVSARRYAARLTAALPGLPRWLLLAVSLGLCLWLGRDNGGAFARTGRLFFLFLTVALGAILLLALPAVDWECLWPPERADWRGIPAGGLLCLSLAGYGIYALCLPCRAEASPRGWPWAAWSCCGMAALLFIVVGTFGPVLTAALADPFLSLLEGVAVPGAFRRGEAALAAVLALGDVVLFTLLARGCQSLWRDLLPGGPGRAGWLWPVLAFLLAESKLTGSIGTGFLVWGNLAGGFFIPTLAFFTKGRSKTPEERSTFCGGKGERNTDVGAKKKIEKNQEENEKKC